MYRYLLIIKKNKLLPIFSILNDFCTSLLSRYTVRRFPDFTYYESGNGSFSYNNLSDAREVQGITESVPLTASIYYLFLKNRHILKGTRYLSCALSRTYKINTIEKFCR